MQEWIQAHFGYVLGGLGVLSIVTFCVSLIAVPFIIARLPKDYFVTKNTSKKSRSLLSNIGQLLRNVLGFIIIFAGILMLILPGQGVLTILIGAFLLDIPGTRALKTRLLKRSRVQIGINWLRFKCGKPPMIWPST